MTIGHLIECLLGKISSINGHQSDATPFTEISVHELSKIMMDKCGFEAMGTQVLYNGKTGEQITAKIFIGPTYYQRLKHLVNDKIHSRSTGPYTLLTRQAAEGRSRAGGLRVGEMERDGIISHGLSQFLKESMMERSDGRNNYITVSNHTGEIAAFNPKRNIYLSPSCDGPLEFEKNKYGELELLNKNNKSYSFSRINIPYCTQLLIHECGAMGVQLRVNTDQRIVIL